MNWESHIIRWGLHAKSRGFSERVSQGASYVRKAKETGQRFAISYSSGKDSTAMLHLALKEWPDCPVITQFDDCDWPTKADYVDQIEALFGISIIRVVPDFSVWAEACKGRPGVDHYCSQSHSLTQDSFLRPLQEAQKEAGCNGVFIGLRAAEGKGRMMNAATRGALYRMKNGQWKCNPLTWWSADDVFAYHVANDIPINPLYQQTAFRNPQEIRVSWALPTPSGYGKDEMAQLAKYFPTQYQKIRKMTGD